MCIIALKQNEIALPEKTTLETCFLANPDGAGVAILRKGEKEVNIHKGFMDFPSFSEFVADAVRPCDIAVYHFRIGTSGGNTPENTHPFPVSKNVAELKALNIKTRFAFIHNGILGHGEKTLSDTQVFIRDTLYTMRERLATKAAQKTLEKLTLGSRTVTIDAAAGLIIKTGDWIQDKATGLFFSNESYKPRHHLFNDYDIAFPSMGMDVCPMCESGNTMCVSERHSLHECDACGCLFDAYGDIWAYGDDSIPEAEYWHDRA